MDRPVVAVRDLSKSFAGVNALDHVTLEIPAGEIHSLAGENGSGKSTLIKVISGVHAPDSGTIELGGESFARLTPVEAIRHGIQVIYQDFSIFPNLTVMENLALPAELASNRRLANWRRFRQIAEEAVSKIDFRVDLDATVGDLSVADKQLVAISRALMSDAKLIIMDEPTTALTNKEVDALFAIILDLKSRGISTLFVSHKLGEIFRISERFTVLRNGRVVVTSQPDQLDRRAFATYMTGRDFEDSRFQAANESAEPVLEVSGLGLRDAFDDVSFALRAGDILGITGLLGSGRTELALALFGALRPDRGQVRVKGQPVTLRGIRSAIASGIGYVPEDRLSEGLMLERSIGDNIVIGHIDTLVTRGMLDNDRMSDEVGRWVEALKIATPNPDNAVNTLSGGNQQKVVLAKWLATKPDILILNGPTVGVDIGSKHDIHEILHRLAGDGMGIIVISDDIPEILLNCNRILLMGQGRIECELDPATTSEEALAAMVAAQPHAQPLGAA
jgi:simple sugar transport system ATP-binding protein